MQSLDLSAVAQHIVPATANTYDLGTAEKPFKDLYLTAGSLHLGSESISIDPSTADLAIGTTVDGEAVTKKVAAYDPSGNLEISGSLNVTGTIEGPSVKNSGFLGSTYESKEINYTHITPAVASDEDSEWDNVNFMINGTHTTTDATGNYSLTMNNVAVVDDDDLGKAYSFDGSSSYIKFAPDAVSGDLFASDRTHTVEMWVKPDNLTCLLYTSPSPRDGLLSRMPSSA